MATPDKDTTLRLPKFPVALFGEGVKSLGNLLIRSNGETHLSLEGLKPLDADTIERMWNYAQGDPAQIKSLATQIYANSPQLRMNYTLEWVVDQLTPQESDKFSIRQVAERLSTFNSDAGNQVISEELIIRALGGEINDTALMGQLAEDTYRIIQIFPVVIVAVVKDAHIADHTIYSIDFYELDSHEFEVANDPDIISRAVTNISKNLANIVDLLKTHHKEVDTINFDLLMKYYEALESKSNELTKMFEVTKKLLSLGMCSNKIMINELMAHDLRGKLNNLRILHTILNDRFGKLDAELIEIILQVCQQAQQEILDYFQFMKIGIGRLAQTSIRDVERSLGHMLQLEIDPELHYQVLGLQAYAVQLILKQVISNAKKYSFKDKAGKLQKIPKLGVYLNGTDLIIEVADYGPGVDDDYKELILQQFGFRVTDAENIEGSGVGLPTVVKYLRRNLGDSFDIECLDHVENDEKVGALFRVRFTVQLLET